MDSPTTSLKPGGSISPPPAIVAFLAPAPDVSNGPSTNTSPLPEKGEPSSSGVSTVERTPTSSAKRAAHPLSRQSEVRRWLTCPMFWKLSQKWVPRAERWTPHRVVGSSIHKAIELWLRRDYLGESISQEPLDGARDVLQNEFIKHEQDTWDFTALTTLVGKGYRALQAAIEERFGERTRVLAVEKAFSGTSRVVDCIVEESGLIGVIDWKSAINLDWATYGGEKQKEVLHSYQLLDYSWHVQEWLKRPVSWAAHGLVIMGPRLLVKWLPVQLTEARLNQWHQDALLIQAQMDGEPWRDYTACTDRHLFYGQECPYIPACHLLEGNESAYSGVYRLREAGDDF